MANRSFASFVSTVSPSVPGCPQPLLVQEIRRSAIRSCERTLAWRHQCVPFNLTPGVAEYFYNKPVGAEVHAVFEAVLNGKPLTRLTMEDAIGHYPEWVELFGGVDPDVAWGNAVSAGFNEAAYNDVMYNDGDGYEVSDEALVTASTPRVITQITPDKFIVLPLPDNAEIYRCMMFVALKPKRTADGMDEVIFNELEDVIMHGALQHLLVMPDTNWTDRDLASYHAKQYSYQLAERRARANLGNARGSMRVKMRPFGV